MTYFHGIHVSEPVTGVRPILEKSTAVIGLLATATAPAGAETTALNETFPLNRPVLITDVRSAIGAAGTGGSLKTALEEIANQGSPLVIVVRVTAGVDAAATNTAMIGGTTAGVYSGMQAFLAAEQELGVRPRIFGAPGFDTQPVTAALVIVAKRLRGFVYASAFGAATVATAVTYRGGFSDRELMLIWPDATGWAGKAIAAAMGLRAVIDETVGWHKSLSNVAIAGFTGLTKDVHFDIRDSSSDAGVLNEGQVTTIVRFSGYRFWGNRTCSDEPLFAFETATRSAQAIQDAIADGLAWAIDKPMTLGLVRDIIETINATLRRWKNEGRIIGGTAYFDPTLNPAEQLSAGQLVIDYDFTPVAPLEGLQLNQRITGKYYVGFGDALLGATAN